MTQPDDSNAPKDEPNRDHTDRTRQRGTAAGPTGGGPTAESPTKRSSAKAESAKADLLIVEDNRLQARVLKDRLIEAGYDVRWAEDGRKGLEAARQRRPDLILSDIEMPHMTGHELCRAIKSDADLKTVPLVLLSTLSQPEDIIVGLDCGADNYVTKPYRLDYLLSRIESLLDTPIVERDAAMELTVNISGKTYNVFAGRQQVLNLLISTFEGAVEKNRELLTSNEALTVARDDLQSTNQRLESMNHRMRRDLDAAARVQRSLLPPTERKDDAIDHRVGTRGTSDGVSPDGQKRVMGDTKVAWEYIPCDELAGDFLNYFPLDDDHVAFFVVDVSGHGVASSLLSVTIGRVLSPDVSNSSLLARQNADGSTSITPPSKVAEILNYRFPMEDQGDLYFTMCYGVLDRAKNQLTYVSAGHNPILLDRRGEVPRYLDAEGFAIGWMADIEYDQHTVQLKPGDRVYLYSDGVPEALDQDLREFDEPRLQALVGRLRARDLESSVTTICDAVRHWCRINGPKDDVSVLAFELPD